MDLSTPFPPERPRKRRAINACAACRSSKVRCDGDRPCQRCTRNNAECEYHDSEKDSAINRIGSLEAEVFALRAGLDAVQNNAASAPQVDAPHTPMSGQSTANFSFVPINSSVSTSEFHMFSNHGTSMPSFSHSTQVVISRGSTCSAVQNGIITWEQASAWFERNVIIFTQKTSDWLTFK